MHGGHSLYKGKVWHVPITTITDLGPNELLIFFWVFEKIGLGFLFLPSQNPILAGVTHNLSAC